MNKNIEKKYIPLAHYFNVSEDTSITLSFSEIETIIGQKLPNAAYLNRSWWVKTKTPLLHYLAWSESGYSVVKVQLGYFVQFEKLNQKTNELLHNMKDNHHTYIIRPAEPDDARAILSLQNLLLQEKSIFYFDDTIHSNTTQSLRKRISQWHTNNNGHILVAIVDGQLLGIAQIHCYTHPTIAHRATLSLAVNAQFEQNEIDVALLNVAEEWASKRNIRRLEIAIIQSKETSIERYQKSGYVIEGTRRSALYVDEDFIDELYMGKILP